MEIFKFDKESITRFIEHELKTLSKFKEPLKYVVNQLVKKKHHLVIKSLDNIDLNKVKECEGKNYYWSVFKYENITLVVRRYRHHLTIFTMVVKNDKTDFDTFEKPRTEYGAFILSTDFEKFGEDKHDEMMDEYYDKPFTDLNVIVKDLFHILTEKDGGVHWVWNSVSLKRPKHVEIKLIFNDNSIHSIDDFAFAIEELECKYQEMFAENTMVQKLSELKTGDKLSDRYTVGKITTTVKDGYYHSVGFEMIDTIFGGQRFQDVYSLTRWYADIVIKEEMYCYNGVFYVEGGKFKVGAPVAYKNIKGSITIFNKLLPEERFTPLKKY